MYSDPAVSQEIDSDFRENRALIQQSWVSGYRAIRDYNWQFAEDISFVGIPSPDALTA